MEFQYIFCTVITVTWKDMVKKESRKIGLDERDAQDRKKWRAGIATWKEWKSATPRKREKVDYNKWWWWWWWWWWSLSSTISFHKKWTLIIKYNTPKKRRKKSYKYIIVHVTLLCDNMNWGRGTRTNYIVTNSQDMMDESLWNAFHKRCGGPPWRMLQPSSVPPPLLKQFNSS